MVMDERLAVISGGFIGMKAGVKKSEMPLLEANS